jgi:hypothetical protein
MDVAILGGALRLLATVTPQHLRASTEIAVDGQEISIAIEAPPLAS